MTDLGRRTLYHFMLCPFSRKVRLVFAFKKIPCNLIHVLPWQPQSSLLQANPIGDLPVLLEPDGSVLTQHNAICEYLNEISPNDGMMGETPKGRAEIRRISSWFDSSFYMDVFKPLVGERVIKALKNGDAPNSLMIRSARDNLKVYFKYVEWTAARRPYLGGKNLTMADLTVASYVSILDYLSEVSWDTYPQMREWYSKIKSRNSFYTLLQDKITGIIPPDHYANLDF